MMNDRISTELRLIKSRCPDVQFYEQGWWILLPSWKLAEGIWVPNLVSICFQVPSAYPGQAPYGFYVQPQINLMTSGQPPTNAQPASDPPFGGTWLKFSWSHSEQWQPTVDPQNGSNLLNFIDSFRARLNEAN